MAFRIIINGDEYYRGENTLFIAQHFYVPRSFLGVGKHKPHFVINLAIQ